MSLNINITNPKLIARSRKHARKIALEKDHDKMKKYKTYLLERACHLEIYSDGEGWEDYSWLIPYGNSPYDSSVNTTLHMLLWQIKSKNQRTQAMLPRLARLVKKRQTMQVRITTEKYNKYTFEVDTRRSIIKRIEKEKGTE